MNYPIYLALLLGFALGVKHATEADHLVTISTIITDQRSVLRSASVGALVAAKEGFSTREIETLMNKQSGLLGISGLTSDMRELLAEAREENDRRAKLTIEIFCYRARKYIGAYLAAMNGADAIVFAGGIGENSPEVRSHICKGLEWIGIELDDKENGKHTGGREGLISKETSRPAVYVIPTDEELLIARDTVRCVLQ